MRNLAELVVKIPLVSAGAWCGGISGAIVGGAVATAAGSLVAMAIVRRMVGVAVREQIACVLRTAAVAVPAMLWLLALRTLSPTSMSAPETLLLLVPGAAVFLVIHLCSAWWSWRIAGRPPGLEAQLISKVRGISARFGHGRTSTG